MKHHGLRKFIQFRPQLILELSFCCSAPPGWSLPPIISCTNNLIVRQKLTLRLRYHLIIVGKAYLTTKEIDQLEGLVSTIQRKFCANTQS